MSRELYLLPILVLLVLHLHSRMPVSTYDSSDSVERSILFNLEEIAEVSCYTGLHAGLDSSLFFSMLYSSLDLVSSSG